MATPHGMGYVQFLYEFYISKILKNSQCNAQISQFLPIYKQFIKNDSVCRVIRIRSLNGKIYSYQLERMRYDQSKNHVLQMFEILNNEFSKSRVKENL